MKLSLLCVTLLTLGASASSAPQDALTPAPQVARIYPSGNLLPANHLKFYLHFSEPMQQGVFLQHCKVVDDRDTDVPEPFRETELWSEDGLRLTLWLHPGRQKTGVNLNTELGPVLQPGRRYKLVVSRAWTSEKGMPLAANIEKTFSVTERVVRQLDVAEWKVEPPRMGSLQPLRITFPAPLDHALLQRCLTLKNASGETISGHIQTAQSEQTWTFTPSAPWPSSSCTLHVQSILEDLAGNSLARPFEVDLQGQPPRKVPPSVSVPIQPVVR